MQSQRGDATARFVDAILQSVADADSTGSRAEDDDGSFPVQPVTPDLETQPDFAATIFTTLGRAYLNSGHLKLGQQLIQRALQLRRQLYGDSHPAIAESMQMIARIHRDDGNLVEAEEAIRQALHMQTQAGQAEGMAVVPVLWELAVIQCAANQLPVAEKTVADAMGIIERFQFERIEPYVPRLWEVLGQVELARGRYAEAAELFAKAMERSALQLGTQSHEYASYVHQLAVARHELGQIEEAEAGFREAIRIYESVNNHHPNLSPKYVNLGQLLLQKGPQFFDEARSSFRRAMAISAHTRGKEHPFYAYDQLNLGRVEFEVGNLPAAHELLQEALHTLRGRTELSKAHVAAGLVMLARIYLESHTSENAKGLIQSADGLHRAQACAEEAVGIFGVEFGEQSVERAIASAVLARGRFMQSGASVETRALLERSYRIIQQAQGPTGRYTLIVAKWNADAA